MALDVQRISLDISKQPTPQQVRLGQGDANATQLIIDIFDDGIAYSLTNYTVRLSMRLPNDGGYYQVSGSKSGNTATFNIDERYAATTYGFDGFGYVDILNGSTVICSTSRFQLVVLRNAADGVELSEQYINAVEEAVNRANEAAEAAEGIVLQAVPTMSANIKGGAKLGSGLAVSNDTLSVNASTVASGTLPIARGGTGATSAAGALTSLGAVAKSGDTMTGILNLKSPNIDRDESDPESDTWGTSRYRLLDKDGEQVGYIGSVRRSDGRQDLAFISSNEKTDGTQIDNSLQIRVAKDGTRSYFVNDQAAFREAIGLSTSTVAYAKSDSSINSVFTPASGYTTRDGSVFYKRNGMVAVNLSMAATNAVAANTAVTVGTITAEIRPKVWEYSLMSGDGSFCYIDTSGNVVFKKISATEAGGSLGWARLSYMANTF